MRCRDKYQIGELVGGRRGYCRLSGQTIVRDDIVLVIPSLALRATPLVAYLRSGEFHDGHTPSVAHNRFS